ncbi:MAG TPA: TolC family protein [Thermoanaerobaculia bacterium]|nr:TolC family protein [Thermoanaerobaculia bacterium]
MFDRISRFVVLFLLPLAAPVAAEADPLAALPRLERDALIRAVLERNPSLQAAREAWRAASARPAQARALPDPMVSYGLAPFSIGSNDVSFGQEVEVSQAFPFPGKRRARAAAAEAEAGAAWEEYRAARLELATAASLLFADYYLVDRAIEINTEHLRLLDELREVSAARYAAGLVPQQEPLQAEVEAAELMHREVELRAERAVVTARINALLHRRLDEPLPPPPVRLAEPAPEGEAGALEEEALAARPELAARAAAVRAREAELDLAKLERKPDFGVMGSYSSMWMDAEHRFMAGISVSLPVRKERLEAARTEAEARLAQERSGLTGREDEIRSEVRAAAARLAETHHLIEIYESRLLPASRDQIQAGRAGYGSGQVGFLSILEAERSLRRAELGYHETLAGLHRRQAELDRALGRLPAGLSDETLTAAPAAGQGGSR